MHEISIASDLKDIVLEAAAKEQMSRVTAVNVVFGEMVQIVPAIFETAFKIAVKDTMAEEAIINIAVQPVKLLCRNCRSLFSLSENLFVCSFCNSIDIEIINGKELYVKTIEGE